MKKRMLACGLLLLMVLSLFSGCKQVDTAGEAAAPSEEVVNTPVTEKTEQDVPMVVPPVETEPEQEDIAKQPVQKEEEPTKEPVEETPAQEEIKEPGDTATKQPAQNQEEEPAEETTTTAPDEKIECTVTLEDSFEPGVILVVIKKEYSSPNIKRTLSDFPNINAKSITNMLDLTEMDSIEVDMSKYRQLYRIELVENTKEATLEAIAEIETLEFVRSATPNMQIEVNLC